MLNATLNLRTVIENFAPGDDVRHALLLTYNFDGVFLEDAERGLLEILWQRDCENVLVVRDGKAMLSEKRSHRYSVINAAYSTRTFHPKLMLLIALSEVLAVVGSVNLTRGGLEGNLELAGVYQLTRTNGPLGFFATLRDYLDGHLRLELRATSPRQREAFDTLVDDFKLFLADARSAHSATEPLFLHNYTEPLLPQILQALPEQELDELWIVSPFFEPDPRGDQSSDESPSPVARAPHHAPVGHDDPPGEALDRTLLDEIFRTLAFVNKKGRPPVRIYFQATTANATQLPLNVLQPYRSQIALHAKNRAAEDQRRLHAKAFVFIGRRHVTVVHGSPNFTRAALLSKPPSGNAEIAVVTQLRRTGGIAEKLGDYLNLKSLFSEIDNWDGLTYHPPVTTSPPPHVVRVWEGMVSLADKKVTVFFRVDHPHAHRVVVTLRGDQGELPLGEVALPLPESQEFALPEGALDTKDALRKLLQLPYHNVRIEAFDAEGRSLGSSEGPLNVDCPGAFVGTWLCRPDDLGLDSQIYLAGLGNIAGYAGQRATVERALSTPAGDSPPAPSHYADLDLFFRRLHIGFRGLRRRLEGSRASRYVFSDILRQLGDWAQTALQDDERPDYTTEQKLYLCDRILQTALECVDVMKAANVTSDELALIVRDRFLLPARPMVDFTDKLCLDQNVGVVASNLLEGWHVLRAIAEGNKR
jgi:hypothetical protein